MAHQLTPGERRLELLVLDMLNHTVARTGVGFGKYPLGALDVLEHVIVACDRNDPAWPAIESALARLKRKLEE